MYTSTYTPLHYMYIHICVDMYMSLYDATMQIICGLYLLFYHSPLIITEPYMETSNAKVGGAIILSINYPDITDAPIL